MTRVQSSRLAALCVGLVALGALSGCSFFAEDELPTLARERAATDVLPPDFLAQLDGSSDDSIDPDSVRLAGDYGGAQFFISSANDDRQTCLVIYVTSENWVWGCNISSQVEYSTHGGYSVRLTREGIIPADTTWVALTDDVLVRATQSASRSERLAD